MRVVVAGLGVQGHKRRRVAGPDFVTEVDPRNMEARHRRIEPLGSIVARQNRISQLAATP